MWPRPGSKQHWPKSTNSDRMLSCGHLLLIAVKDGNMLNSASWPGIHHVSKYRTQPGRNHPLM